MKFLNNNKGFTLIELMIVVAIIAILANLSLPHYYSLTKKADAARVIGDLHSIHTALSTYYAAEGEYPVDHMPGEKPAELSPYLMDDFSFVQAELNVQYDWENWSGKASDSWRVNPTWSQTNTIYGVSITTEDMALVNTIQGMLGEENFHYTLGQNYTYVIEPGIVEEG